MAGTRRQQIARLLRESPRTVLELSRIVKSPVKSVLIDLEHVRRGLKEGDRWTVIPAECQGCGFVFRERERLNRPSRCPKCRSEEILEGAFGISRESEGA
jgi:predicted Zn-ribbon and HTH transcriptional regulator